MAMLRLQTVQRRDVLEEIKSGVYKPDFRKSLGSDDDVCRDSYYCMLNALSLKTGRGWVKGKETCIWSWYQNPYYLNHLNIENNVDDLVVITFEIDEELVLLSDFDKWCNMFIDGDMNAYSFLFNRKEIKEEQCVQAVCWGIPKDGIISVESFEKFRDKHKVLVSSFISMYNELKKARA